MNHRAPMSAVDTLWDASVVLLFVSLAVGLPDIFSGWVALGSLPLLATRAAIVRTELRLRT